MNSDFSVAIHALVYLSHRKCYLSSEVLAKNVCTNPVRVRRVMSRLVKGDFVQTREGLEGGYCLARPAQEIYLDQVAHAQEVCFVSTTWKTGDTQQQCLIASGMGSMMDRLYGRLNDLCMQELSHITLAQVEEKLFEGKALQETTPCGRTHLPKAE